MAGQLKNFLNEWTSTISLHLTSSCLLEFNSEPLCLPRNVTRESKFFPQQQLTIDDETKTFLAKGAIGSSVSEPSKVESPFFAGRKENLKFRVIFNLKFKMVTLESSLKLMSIRVITWLQHTCEMHTIEAIPIAAEFKSTLSLFEG